MLNKEMLDETNQLMEKYGAKEWKLIEDIPNVKFPTAAFAHFLIVPGDKLDLTKMRKLTEAIEDLLPGKYLEFYTPDDLDNLVSEKKLKSEMRNSILEKKTAELSNQTNSTTTIAFFNTPSTKSQQTIRPTDIPIESITTEFIEELYARKLQSIHSQSEKRDFITKSLEQLNTVFTKKLVR